MPRGAVRAPPTPLALLIVIFGHSRADIARIGNADLQIWFADPSTPGSPPEEDTCYAQTAFGTTDATAGCGIPLAVDGVAVDASTYQSEVTFIANARNAIFVTTTTWNEAAIGSQVDDNISMALQVSSETSDGVVLCSQATVLREGYDQGLKDIAITGLDDPTTPRNDATIWAREQGNTLYVIPYTLRQVHGPPYPQLTIVLIPKLVTENIMTNCTTDEETSVETCDCTSPWVMQGDDSCKKFLLESYEPIEFTVNVRTRPEIEPLRSEVVENCDYAFAQDHIWRLGSQEVTTSSAPAAPPASRTWGWLAACGSAALLHLVQSQRRTMGLR